MQWNIASPQAAILYLSRFTVPASLEAFRGIYKFTLPPCGNTILKEIRLRKCNQNTASPQAEINYFGLRPRLRKLDMRKCARNCVSPRAEIRSGRGPRAYPLREYASGCALQEIWSLTRVGNFQSPFCFLLPTRWFAASVPLLKVCGPKLLRTNFCYIELLLFNFIKIHTFKMLQLYTLFVWPKDFTGWN